MTTTQQTEAIILLYPSKTQTMTELRQSASDFCVQNNITVIDVISPSDEYDYFAMRRLSEIIRYRREPMALITNRDILTMIPPLTLWSILDATTSSKSIELMRSFLQELKESSSKANNNQNLEDFRILNHKEVSYMSESLESIRYAVMRDNKAYQGQQL